MAARPKIEFDSKLKYSIKTVEVLDLFVSTVSDISKLNFDVIESRNKRNDWVINVMSASLILFFTAFGKEVIKDAPKSFIFIICNLIFSLLLSLKYKDLVMMERLITQRNLTNFPFIRFILYKELINDFTIKIKSMEYNFEQKIITNEELIDRQLSLFEEGSYFPEPMRFRFQMDRLRLFKIQKEESIIKRTLHLSLMIQFILFLNFLIEKTSFYNTLKSHWYIGLLIIIFIFYTQGTRGWSFNRPYIRPTTLNGTSTNKKKANN